ncbi:hypothetical protein LCGC14_0869570 [marine sediment metagenome]|uniref:DUF1737 domain-containing protein n=1 Tax=marine sediment metagenome TaxID=412755 RepID=A0A0F9RPS0_9ZZZZ
MNKYVICRTYSIGKLEIEVNQYIKNGYLPIGNLVVDNEAEFYCQAMLKHESPFLMSSFTPTPEPEPMEVDTI